MPFLVAGFHFVKLVLLTLVAEILGGRMWKLIRLTHISWCQSPQCEPVCVVGNHNATSE